MSAEKRAYRRLNALLDLTLGGVRLMTENISLSGVQMTCPAMHYQLIAMDLGAPEVPIVLALPGQGTANINCTVAYASDHEDDYLLGLHFASMEAPDRERLEAYLVAAGGPEFLHPAA